MSQQITIPGPGDLLADRYRISDELGRGSYGVVFKAVEEGTGRLVAIKTLLPQSVLDREVIDRFEREAQLVSRLDHRNVIGLHDYGQRDNLFYMVMEFIEGRSLDDLLNDDAPVSPELAQDLLVQTMEALQHAHERGIVHRDLKPANILLQPASGGKEVVKVLDFGIAKALRDENQDMKTLTQAGHVLGTPHYMSPEQIIGDDVDHRADVYAMGVILYELLVGEHPFEGKSPTAVIVAHLHSDPPPLPAHLERSKWGMIVREALRKQPDDRLASADQFLHLLRREHDVIDDDESGEVTALFTPSSLTESDDQGATQEMKPLTHLPGLTGATMQWQRPEKPALPSFGAQPVAAAAPSSPAPVFPKVDAVPLVDVVRAANAPKKRNTLLLLVGVLFLLCLGMIAYQLWFSTPRPDDVPPRDDTVLATAFSGDIIDMGQATKDLGMADVATPSDLGVQSEQDDLGVADQGVVDAGPIVEPPTKPRPKPPTPKSPSEVSLSITSKPSNALVFVGNREIGKTPLTHKLKRSDKTVSVSVSMMGFSTKKQSVKPTKNRKVSFSLEPTRLSP